MRPVDDWVVISSLQHYAYCPRQCALINIEYAWDDNVYTSRGRRLHETVHRSIGRVYHGRRVELNLPIWSQRLRIHGVADVVEFDATNVPVPIEYKSGRRKKREADEIQVAAQAICLEEMFGVPVQEGAIFYHASRRRTAVKITPSLRDNVAKIAEEVRALVSNCTLPPPVNDRRCVDCSLYMICLPRADLYVLGDT